MNGSVCMRVCEREHDCVVSGKGTRSLIVQVCMRVCHGEQCRGVLVKGLRLGHCISAQVGIGVCGLGP